MHMYNVHCALASAEQGLRNRNYAYIIQLLVKLFFQVIKAKHKQLTWYLLEFA